MRAVGKGLFFLLVVLILIGVLFVFREILQLYGRADSDVKLGVITAVGSAIAFLANNAIQSSRERKSRLFEAKREAYARYFRFFMSIFGRLESNPVTEDEMVAEVRAIATEIMTWGSAETINSFNAYQRNNAAGSPNQQELFRSTEAFLRALRKDLGHDDKSLENLALTKMNLRGNEHANLDVA